jgi:hypothetical protein
MMIIRQSTSIDVAIGPFLDDTDGKTAETGLTITQPDIRLKKNGGAWAQKSAAQTLSHEENGWYEVSLSTTDTDTVGQLIVAVLESGALPVWREFQVVEEAIYDALLAASATGLLPANVTQFGGSNGTFAGGRPEVNASHWGGTAVASANVRIDGAITAAKIASDAIQAAKIQDGALTAAKFAAGAFDAVWSVAARLLTAGTNIVLAKGTGVTGFNDPAAPAIADAVWDEAISGHQTAGTTGKALTDAGGGGTPPTAGEVADAVWDEALSGHGTAGTAGAALSAAAAGSSSGPGAIAWVVEVDDGADPIQGAHVWVSTNEAGSNVVAGALLTDSFGRVTFMLDAGTYYAWIRKDGFNPLLAADFAVA